LVISIPIKDDFHRLTGFFLSHILPVLYVADFTNKVYGCLQQTRTFYQKIMVINHNQEGEIDL